MFEHKRLGEAVCGWLPSSRSNEELIPRMKQLGISFSSKFDDNAVGNVGIRILSRVAYPISPLTENKTSGRNVDFEAVSRFLREKVREREKEKKKDKEDKEDEKRKKEAKRSERR